MGEGVISMESFDAVISLPTGYVLYALYHCYAAATYLGNLARFCEILRGCATHTSSIRKKYGVGHNTIPWKNQKQNAAKLLA